MKCENKIIGLQEVPHKTYPVGVTRPCPNKALSGFIWCLPCIHAEAEALHRADKERWAKEAEEAKKEKKEEGEL